MHQRPEPAWYLYAADASRPARLLDDDGCPEPSLTGDAERTLAELVAAVHAAPAGSVSLSCDAWSRPSRCSAGDAEKRPSVRVLGAAAEGRRAGPAGAGADPEVRGAPAPSPQGRGSRQHRGAVQAPARPQAGDVDGAAAARREARR